MQNFARRYTGFTLIELLCVIGIVAVLAAILVPTVAAARRRGQSTTCLNNIRQQSVALQNYVQDNDGTYPSVLNAAFIRDHASGGTTWYTLLQAYTNHAVVICPARVASVALAADPVASGYALNIRLNERRVVSGQASYVGINESSVHRPAMKITLFDVRAGIFASGEPDISGRVSDTILFPWNHLPEIRTLPGGATRHNGGGNYAFADGHAKWLLPEVLVRLCGDATPCLPP